MTEDLADWLRTTLDRVEGQATTRGTWTAQANGSIFHDGPSLSQTNERWGRYVVASVGAYDGGRPTEADAEHIVFWQPLRVLKLVEATRRTLDEPSASTDGSNAGKCWTCEDIPPCTTLRLSAVWLGDQPGYAQSRRPS